MPLIPVERYLRLSRCVSTIDKQTLDRYRMMHRVLRRTQPFSQYRRAAPIFPRDAIQISLRWPLQLFLCLFEPCLTGSRRLVFTYPGLMQLTWILSVAYSNAATLVIYPATCFIPSKTPLALIAMSWSQTSSASSWVRAAPVTS